MPSFKEAGIGHQEGSWSEYHVFNSALGLEFQRKCEIAFPEPTINNITLRPEVH
jgi:hypothetical protein